MHLDSLTIKNFRLLEDVEVKKLGHVNLIVGKNNSGKSTVLEALALLASGFEVNTVYKLTSNREMRRHLAKDEDINDFKSISFQQLFNSIALRYEETEIYIGNSDYFLSLKYDELFFEKHPDVAVHQYYVDGINHEGIVVSSNFQLNHLNNTNTFLNSKHSVILKHQYIDTNPVNMEELADSWDDIILTTAEDLAIQMLKIVEPKIIDLAFINTDRQRAPFVRLNGFDNRVPLHQMGDGIFRLLQVILKVLKAKDGFLLIDEFENGLHYSVQPEVWRLIFELAKRFNIQVFATTHSWDCIESFAQVAKEREDLEGVLFRMGRSARKSDKGKVIATVYDEDELYYITKAKMEVR